MVKEFGKLSLENLIELKEIFDELLKLLDLFRNMPREQTTALMENCDAITTWAVFYTLPFHEHLGFLITALDLDSDLSYAASQPDPQTTLLSMWKDKEITGWKGGYKGYFSEWGAIAIVLSVLRSFESILIYDRSLNRLVEDLRNGDNKALRKILQIDHTALFLPDIAHRLMYAELEHDVAIFSQLGNALKSKHEEKFDKRVNLELRELRFFLTLLDEVGELERLSEAERYDLFCEKLQVYPGVGSDRYESLNRYIREWLKKQRS